MAILLTLLLPGHQEHPARARACRRSSRPPVLDVLVENFNIAPITTPEADLKAILG